MTTKSNNQKSSENETRLLSSEERAVFSQIASKEAPDSQRAQALLAIDEGATQAEAGLQAGLTKGQVRYWLDKFRKDGTSIFPDELLNQTQPEDADAPQSSADMLDPEQAAGAEEVPQEMPDAEETAGPVVEAAAQQEDAPKAKKKPKKKSKKTKKAKKVKKPKQAKKTKKSAKKKGSKKAKGTKGKSGKKSKNKGQK